MHVHNIQLRWKRHLLHFLYTCNTWYFVANLSNRIIISIFMDVLIGKKVMFLFIYLWNSLMVGASQTAHIDMIFTCAFSPSDITQGLFNCLCNLQIFPTSVNRQLDNLFLYVSANFHHEEPPPWYPVQLSAKAWL